MLIKRLAVFIGTALLLVFISPYSSFSQPRPGNPPQQTGEKDYTVGPKDEISVKVWGEDMEITTEVSSDGTIQFFFLREIKVAGLNTTEIKSKTENLLQSKGYLSNPVVIVNIEEYKSKEVQIHGAINNPGIYYLETNYTTLLNLISKAGGTSENRGRLAYVWRGGAKKVNIREKGSKQKSSKNSGAAGKGSDTNSPEKIPAPLQGMKKIEVNIQRLLDEGDVSENVVVFPGDFVLINSLGTENPSENYVWVEGEVKDPQQIPYQSGLTVLQAVIKAGGVTDLASPNRTQITREGADGERVTFKVRLKDIQKGNRPDVALQAGDRVYVPESWW